MAHGSRLRKAGFSRPQQGYIHRCLDEARSLAKEELLREVSEEASAQLGSSFQHSANYLRGFLDSVWRVPSIINAADRYGVRLVNAEDFNDRRVNPVVPFQSDANHESAVYAGLDLITLEIINADDMRDRMVLDSAGWHVAPGRWNNGVSPVQSQNTDQIEYLLDTVWSNGRASIAEMLGQCLLYPLPKMMVIKGKSGIGKSSLFDIFGKVFGKGISHYMPNCKFLFRERSEFTFFEDIVCKHVLITYDEADKTNGVYIPDHVLRDATAPSHTIVMKQLNPVSRNRTGMVVLMGNDWPLIDVGKEGAKRRLWAYKIDHAEEMTEDDYFRCIQSDALTWLFQRVVREAHDIFLARMAAEDEGDLYDIPQDQEAFEEMLEYLRVDTGPNLSDWYEIDRSIQDDKDLDSKGIWASDILEILQDAMDEKRLHKEVKAMFKNIIFKRKTRHEGKEYKYALKELDNTVEE